MRRCEDEKIRRCKHEKKDDMCRCEDEKMRGREDEYV